MRGQEHRQPVEPRGGAGGSIPAHVGEKWVGPIGGNRVIEIVVDGQGGRPVEAATQLGRQIERGELKRRCLIRERIELEDEIPAEALYKAHIRRPPLSVDKRRLLSGARQCIRVHDDISHPEAPQVVHRAGSVKFSSCF